MATGTEAMTMSARGKWLAAAVALGAFLAGGIGGYELGRRTLGVALEGVSFGYVASGQEAIRHKDHIRAIAYLNRAVALDHTSQLAHEFLAQAYEMGRRFDLAIEEYRLARELLEDSRSRRGDQIGERIEQFERLMSLTETR